MGKVLHDLPTISSNSLSINNDFKMKSKEPTKQKSSAVESALTLGSQKSATQVPISLTGADDTHNCDNDIIVEVVINIKVPIY